MLGSRVCQLVLLLYSMHPLIWSINMTEVVVDGGGGAPHVS